MDYSEGPKSIRGFLSKYRDRGYYVLRALLDSSRIVGRAKLGDFETRDVKDLLAKYGLDYNPVPLLARLEKEYGIIRTTYRSESQHWWDLVDKKSLEEAIHEYEGSSGREDDPKVKLLKVQFYSLDPENILNTLSKLSRRKRIGVEEKNIIRKIAFNELPMIVDFLIKARAEYEEELLREISIAEKIIELSETLVEKIINRGLYRVVREEGFENNLGI
ncbi:MAG: hypothetical protein F7B11_00670 [Caldisphaeraceae archaeon]|nr:hypothetical protein [Caldisphaeraceae archaeon]